MAFGDGIRRAGDSIANAITTIGERKKEQKSLDVLVNSLRSTMGDEDFKKSGIGDIVDATKGTDNRFKTLSDFIAVRQAVQKQETPDEKRFKDIQADLAKQGISVDLSHKQYSQISDAVQKSKDAQGPDAANNPYADIANAVNSKEEKKSRDNINAKIIERGQKPVDTADPQFMDKAQAAFAQPDLAKNKTLEEDKVKNKSQLISDDVDRILNIVNTSNIGLEKSKGLVPEAKTLFDQMRVNSNVPLLTSNNQTLNELQGALGSLRRNASFSDAGKSLTNVELGIINPLLDINGKTSQRISQDLGKFKSEWQRLSDMVDGKTTTGATTGTQQQNSTTGSTIDKYFEGL